MSNRNALDLSTRTVKIYASAFDATARADIDAHLLDISNPHDVTADQIGLGAVDNTSDADKPLSTAQSDALALKAPLDSPALTGMPTGPTAAVGTITVQLATTAFAYAAANDVVANMATDDTPLADHLADISNPHSVTKAQVGLGLADNTADLDKPVSNPTQAAINAAVAGVGGDTIADDLAEHLADVANPHGTTKAQVGLGAVDNTADLAKPVSSAQQSAINVASSAAAAAQADVDGHQANVSNPHSVTKAQVGLGAVDNTSDLAKPVSTATQAAINAAVAGVGGDTIADDLAEHLADTANPHAVDKTDVGLGAVDNTADIDKPVSTATQLAINAAVAGVGGDTIADDLAEHLADTANPHAVDKTDVGLGAVDNTADIDKPVSTATQLAINAAVAGVGGDTIADDLAEHIADTANPHSVTKSQVGLGSVDNTADIAKPVSDPTQIAINVVAAATTAAQADIDGHQANTSNPHGTTKAQIGLGSADNTADLAKPVSSATQIALNLKAPLASPALTGAPTTPTAAAGTSTTQIASTAFAKAAADAVSASLTTAINLKAPLASPGLTGTPTAPTAAPLTNTTQIATTAYADAAVVSLQPDIDAAAEAAAEAQADATQALADAAAAQAAADAAQATADEALGVASAPGAAVALYGETKTGPGSAAVPIDPTWVTTSGAGAVIRVVAAVADDPQTVTPISPFPLEPGRIYEVRYRVQRQVDPLDPLNDSVTCGVQWLTNALADHGSATVDDIALVITDGVVERIARIGIAPPVTVTLDHTAPAGTIYFRPFIDCYGGDAHTTDIITLSVLDVTASAGCCGAPVNVVSPVTGGTVTIADLRPHFINSLGTLAALTIKLPPVTAGLVEVGFAHSITALAIQDAAGVAVANTPTNAYGPGSAHHYRYAAGLGWLHWK